MIALSSLMNPTYISSTFASSINKNLELQLSRNVLLTPETTFLLEYPFKPFYDASHAFCNKFQLETLIASTRILKCSCRLPTFV